MGKQRREKLLRRRVRDIVLAVAWFRREQWGRLREVARDWVELEKTYDEWEAAALVALEGLRARGLEPQRVDVDVEELARWCQAEGRYVDGAARAEFAAIKLRQRNEMH